MINLVKDKADMTKSWAENVALEIRNLATAQSKDKEIIEYRMYYGTIDKNAFNYLNKIGKYYLPAKVRWVPYVKPKIQNLRSRKNRRGFHFSVFLSDEDSLRNKNTQMIQYVIKQIEAKYKAVRMQYEAQILQIQQQMQMLQQQAQQQPQNEEQAMQLQQLQQQLPMIMQQYNAALEELSEGKALNEDANFKCFKYIALTHGFNVSHGNE